MSNPHAWHSERQMHADALALGACALLRDPDSTFAILSGLTRTQLTGLCWTLACFWTNAVENDLGDEALDAFRRVALLIADDPDAA